MRNKYVLWIFGGMSVPELEHSVTLDPKDVDDYFKIVVRHFDGTKFDQFYLYRDYGDWRELIGFYKSDSNVTFERI